MFLFKTKILPINDINSLALSKIPKKIYILGNGPSLNNYSPEQLTNKFVIGTNRSWLWGKTNILVWRDSRITDELQLFSIKKDDNSIWITSKDKYKYKTEMKNTDFVTSQLDYFFHDSWKNKILKCNIRWNGIIFHAIAIAKFLSPNASIHLIGVDLLAEDNSHHFFNIYKGFDRGYFKNNWDQDNFNYQKRLNMMLNNFVILKKQGLEIINHSENSKLSEIIGYTKL
tara:strand:- start:2526 stop:3209 length:684 start_codon:yes stop_codon:yes gene_type:complete